MGQGCLDFFSAAYSLPLLLLEGGSGQEAVLSAATVESPDSLATSFSQLKSEIVTISPM